MMMENKMQFIAHFSKDGRVQSISDHLLAVSSAAALRAEKIGLGSLGALAGLLHDLGKYSQKFQQYLCSAVGLLEQDEDGYVDAARMKGKIDHSTAGAQVLWETLSKQGPMGRFVGQVLALCVASHHSGLIDCVDVEGNDRFSKRVTKADAESHREEAWKNIEPVVRERYEELMKQDLVSPIKRIMDGIHLNEKSRTITRLKTGFLARFLLSCLTDADHSDSADFEWANRRPNRYEGWLVLIDRLEKSLERFKSSTGHVNEVRQEVSRHCLAAAGRGKRIWTLTVPTGGGKTLSSLRFALHHAKKHGLDRIFYFIPFTTIIDQNAKEIRAILEPEGAEPGTVVLEHHSNLIPERQTWRNKTLSENWDSPVVLSTMVQFLEALFGAGTRNVRRMHSLANSVIIFDEIQTLPVKCVHLFNNAVNFLVEQCGCSVVLCTATQPSLGKVNPDKGSMHLGPDSEIIPNVDELFSSLRRVEVHDLRKPGGWGHGETTKLALERVEISGSCLIVTNTKAAARHLFRLCKGSPGMSVFHLSTNMCPAHRKQRLAEIIRLLDEGKPVLCISTQLIEAGIDVDFGSVIRFLAGLPSVAQASGRCNRHGKNSLGHVYIVNPSEDDQTDSLPDIHEGKHTGSRVLNEQKKNQRPSAELLTPETMARHSKYYFYNRAEEMDYPVTAEEIGREDTLLCLLSDNSKAIEGKSFVTPLLQSFMTAAKNFKVIDACTQGLIVPY